MLNAVLHPNLSSLNDHFLDIRTFIHFFIASYLLVHPPPPTAAFDTGKLLSLPAVSSGKVFRPHHMAEKERTEDKIER